MITVVATVSGTANHIPLTGTVTFLEGKTALQTHTSRCDGPCLVRHFGSRPGHRT